MRLDELIVVFFCRDLVRKRDNNIVINVALVRLALPSVWLRFVNYNVFFAIAAIGYDYL